MKQFAVPVFALGITAVLSVMFYLGFARLFGDTMLGQIILALSSVALLQIAVVPQSWVYIVAAHDEAEIARRFSTSAAIEWIGGSCGLALLLLATLLPVLAVDRAALVFQFVALWAAGSTSAQGYFRAREDWPRYIGWVVTPNLVRVALVAAAFASGLRSRDRATLVLVFFLAPDLARYALFNLPAVGRHFRMPGRAAIAPAAARILQNWLFDMGSALTEVADKVTVGALLGSQLLVVYFFARKLGVAATMVIEPLYAEHFRRVLRAADAARHRIQRRVYLLGLAAALTIAALTVGAVVAVSLIPPLARLMPQSVVVHLALFTGLVLIDCLIAANRWSRYLSQMAGSAKLLLAVRVVLFGAFSALLASGVGLLAAFATFWCAEALFVGIWLGRDRTTPAVAA